MMKTKQRHDFAVYGSKNPVQRCRNHKIRNVLGYLSEDQKDQVKCVMKSAFSMEAKLKELNEESDIDGKSKVA